MALIPDITVKVTDIVFSEQTSKLIKCQAQNRKYMSVKEGVLSSEHELMVINLDGSK